MNRARVTEAATSFTYSLYGRRFPTLRALSRFAFDRSSLWSSLRAARASEWRREGMSRGPVHHGCYCWSSGSSVNHPYPRSFRHPPNVGTGTGPERSEGRVTRGEVRTRRDDRRMTEHRERQGDRMTDDPRFLGVPASLSFILSLPLSYALHLLTVVSERSEWSGKGTVGTGPRHEPGDDTRHE